jgi:type IV pilus assembly protein PilA
MAQPPYPPAPPQGPPPGYPPQGYYGPPGGSPYGPPPRSGLPGWLIAIFVVLGVVLMFGGILGVLAIYGVRKYIANAKTAEARNSLGMIARSAQAAFERDHRLCPSASRTVPGSVVDVSGKKYLSSAADWQVDAARHAGFACLGFSMAMPQYYTYSYKAHGVNAPGDGFEATAVGDLNGDGKTSLFKISGTVSPAGTLNIQPNLVEQDPEE